MTQRYQASSGVLSSIRQKLALARNRKPEEILDEVAAALTQGRGYAFAGIYLAIEKMGVRQASSGSSLIGQTQYERVDSTHTATALDSVNAEIAVPIRLGARTLGLIVVESGWTSGSQAHGAARQERVLVEQTARLVAQYLTTDRAKQLLRKTRERARQTAGAVQPHKSPQSARPALRRAAAGERSAR